jgi:hypothetical protein
MFLVTEMTSIGKIAHCKKLMCEELGSESQPINTIHMASTFQLQNHLAFKEGDDTRLLIQKDGHLAISQNLHLYDSTNINTGNLRYSLGLSPDGTKFQIKNEVTNTVVLEADDSGSESIQMSSIQGLVDALNAKQAKLTVNGGDVSTTVLNTFALTSGGDGVSYSNSLVTAGAIENFIENVLQPSMLTVQAGQASGVRVGTIPTSSPSNVNVPSVKAVHDYLQTHYMTISEIGSSFASFNHNHDSDYVPIPTNASFGGAAVMRNQTNTAWEYTWPILFHIRLTPSGNGDVTFDPVSKTIAYTPPSLNFLPLPNGTPSTNDVVQWDGTNWVFAQISGGSSVSLSTITDWPANISATEVSYLDGVTSSIQTQLNNKLSHPVTLNTFVANGAYFDGDVYVANNNDLNISGNVTASNNVSISNNLTVNGTFQSTTHPIDSNSNAGFVLNTGITSNYFDFGSQNQVVRWKELLTLEQTFPSSWTGRNSSKISINAAATGTQTWYDLTPENANTSSAYLFVGRGNAYSVNGNQNWTWFRQVYLATNSITYYTPSVVFYVTSMTVTGSVFASSYTTTSDERIKKNISLANISSAYETVAAVQMHEYEYNRSTNPRTRWGFIAQQLEEVIPEAVQTITGNYTAEGERIDKENSKNEVLAHTDQKYVSKEKMFQCLFAAFQEAQKKIADLETRMVKLEGQA